MVQDLALIYHDMRVIQSYIGRIWAIGFWVHWEDLGHCVLYKVNFMAQDIYFVTRDSIKSYKKTGLFFSESGVTRPTVLFKTEVGTVHVLQQERARRWSAQVLHLTRQKPEIGWNTGDKGQHGHLPEQAVACRFLTT